MSCKLCLFYKSVKFCTGQWGIKVWGVQSTGCLCLQVLPYLHKNPVAVAYIHALAPQKIWNPPFQVGDELALSRKAISLNSLLPRTTWDKCTPPGNLGHGGAESPPSEAAGSPRAAGVRSAERGSASGTAPGFGRQSTRSPRTALAWVKHPCLPTPYPLTAAPDLSRRCRQEARLLY